jgi:hypothetical protein
MRVITALALLIGTAATALADTGPLTSAGLRTSRDSALSQSRVAGAGRELLPFVVRAIRATRAAAALRRSRISAGDYRSATTPQLPAERIPAGSEKVDQPKQKAFNRRE